MTALASLAAAVTALPLPAKVALGAVVAVGAVVGLALVWVYREMIKPPPTGGTPFKLPNGMTIAQWQKSETEFLYGEIWGPESAYKAGGLASRSTAAVPAKDAASTASGDPSAFTELTFEPGATIIDAGANIGMFSLFAARECRGDATIFAFEPIPSTHSVLAANARSANEGAFADVFKPAPLAKLRINALNVGLSDRTETVTFEHHPHFSVWSTRDATFAHDRLQRIIDDLPRAAKTSDSALFRMLPSWIVRWLATKAMAKLGVTEKVPARLVRLSDVIEEQGIRSIDVLKIDVEGAEEAVLRGLEERHWKKVQQVVLEVESFAIRDRILATLHSHGFRTHWFASERARNPGVHSEVCMMYGVRPEYANRGSKRP